MTLDNNKLASAIRRRKKIDDHTCLNCGYNKGVPLLDRHLAGHHTYDKDNHPKLAYKIKFLRTLCEKCHIRFHTKYMGGFQVECTLTDYRVWRIKEEILHFSWLKRLLYAAFKIFR